MKTQKKGREKPSESPAPPHTTASQELSPNTKASLCLCWCVFSLSVFMLVCVCLCVGDLQGGAAPLPLVYSVVRKFSLNQAKPLTWQPALTSSRVANANRKPFAFPIVHTPSVRAVSSQLRSQDYPPESHWQPLCNVCALGDMGLRPQAGDIRSRSTCQLTCNCALCRGSIRNEGPTLRGTENSATVTEHWIIHKRQRKGSFTTGAFLGVGQAQCSVVSSPCHHTWDIIRPSCRRHPARPLWGGQLSPAWASTQSSSPLPEGSQRCLQSQ